MDTPKMKMRQHDHQSALYTGDCRQILPELSAQGVKVQTCITSPPYYGLRDCGCTGQIGLEPTVNEYVGNLVEAFRLVRDVLADNGTLWLNMGDSYAGSGKGRLKAKDLIGIPWRVALALQADGWYLRQDIIWHKTNPMPESVTDRCVRSHEYLFLLSKNSRYYFDHEAIREPSDSYERPGADRQNDFCRAKGKYTAAPIPANEQPNTAATASIRRRVRCATSAAYGRFLPWPPATTIWRLSRRN